MAMTVEEIKEWLDLLDCSDEVGIDEGGLCLVVASAPYVYLEIGGIDDDEDSE